jgi:hypothetical protein
MPEQRLARTRATLPESYQFGDGQHRHNWGTVRDPRSGEWHCGCGARLSDVAVASSDWTFDPNKWQPAHRNAVVRLGWNTIEQEQH